MKSVKMYSIIVHKNHNHIESDTNLFINTLSYAEDRLA